MIPEGSLFCPEHIIFGALRQHDPCCHAITHSTVHAAVHATGHVMVHARAYATVHATGHATAHAPGHATGQATGHVVVHATVGYMVWDMLRDVLRDILLYGCRSCFFRVEPYPRECRLSRTQPARSRCFDLGQTVSSRVGRWSSRLTQRGILFDTSYTQATRPAGLKLQRISGECSVCPLEDCCLSHSENLRDFLPFFAEPGFFPRFFFIFNFTFPLNSNSIALRRWSFFLVSVGCFTLGDLQNATRGHGCYPTPSHGWHTFSPSVVIADPRRYC